MDNPHCDCRVCVDVAVLKSMGSSTHTVGCLLSTAIHDTVSGDNFAGDVGLLMNFCKRFTMFGPSRVWLASAHPRTSALSLNGVKDLVHMMYGVHNKPYPHAVFLLEYSRPKISTDVYAALATCSGISATPLYCPGTLFEAIIEEDEEVPIVSPGIDELWMDCVVFRVSVNLCTSN